MNTKTVKSSKINKAFFVLAIILLTIILCLTYVHFGSTNIGYDGDEVFSYMSSNAEQGYKKLAALEDHTWYPSSYFRNALSVPSSCRFHYERSHLPFQERRSVQRNVRSRRWQS